MISKWQEVDLELFFEIFNRYWNAEGTTAEKVLEVQDLYSIFYKKENNNRMFYGNKINIHDFPRWNESILETVNKFRGNNPFAGRRKNIDECMISNAEILDKDGIYISPLGAVPQHYDLNKYLYFGEDYSVDPTTGIDFSDILEKITKCPRFFYKEGDMYRLPWMNEVNPVNAKVRIRTWDYKEWKYMTYEFEKNDCQFPKYIRSEDIPAEKILPPKKT